VKRKGACIREIFLKCESDDYRLFERGGDTTGASLAEQRESHPIRWISDVALGADEETGTFRLAAQRHDDPEAPRRDRDREKTKAGIATVGGMALGMMKDLAISPPKKEAAEKLGIQP
jgi:hypothetical protein